jgi:intein/homing endonuclease
MDLNSNSWNIHLKNISKLGVKARQRKIKKDLLDGEKILKNKLKSKEFTLILARLCGYIMGDGSIIHGKERNRNAIHYDIRFYPDDLDMAKIYIDSFEKIYSKRPSLKELKNHFRVSVSSRLAVEHLNSISRFGTMDWKVPFGLLIDDEHVCEFLRAFFDCEAYVGKNKIDVQSVNKEGLESVAKLLEILGINTRFYSYERKQKNWNTNYILVISRKENIIKYANLIGFNHSAKSDKLAGIA